MALDSTPVICRRKHPRFTMPPGTAWLEFPYPAPGGYVCRMRLRDLSASGISFLLSNELPGLDIGRTLARATLVVPGHQLHGDVLVMHLTPDCGKGSVCGALFFPRDDDDILGLQALIQELEGPLPD